jgi:hypothetical protein
MVSSILLYHIALGATCVPFWTTVARSRVELVEVSRKDIFIAVISRKITFSTS